MLLLYYNPTTKNYYIKYYKRILNNYFVGYMNQYGHFVVKILVIEDELLIDVMSTDQYLVDRYLNRDRKQSFKTRLKNRLIDFLIKL